MPGTWLTRIAQRLTREETFERLVSPAIADLQRESAQGPFLRTRHYAAIAIVMVWALSRDFRADLTLAFDADACRRIWTRVALWAVAVGVFNWLVVSTLTWRFLNQVRFEGSVELVMYRPFFMSFAPALTVATIVAAYNLRRRAPTRMRAVVAATVVLIATMLLVSNAANTLQEPARRAWDEIVSARYPVPVVVTRPPVLWQMLVAAVHMVPFAWLGVVLARRRGWPLALVATAILGTWQWLQWSGATFRLVAAFDQLVPGLLSIMFGTYSIPSSLLTLPAAILAWRMIESRIDRRQALHGQTPHGPTRPGTV